MSEYSESYAKALGIDDPQHKKNGGYIIKMKCYKCRKPVNDDENKMVYNIDGKLVYICGDCIEEMSDDELDRLNNYPPINEEY